MPCSMISCIIYVLQYVVLGCLCSSVFFFVCFCCVCPPVLSVACCVFIFSSILCFIFYVLQYVMLQCVYSLVFCVAFSLFYSVLCCVVLCCSVCIFQLGYVVYFYSPVCSVASLCSSVMACLMFMYFSCVVLHVLCSPGMLFCVFMFSIMLGCMFKVSVHVTWNLTDTNGNARWRSTLQWLQIT